MPYHSGSGGLHRSFARRMVMSDSSITTSTIDMNFNNITSVKDPIRPQDAATRYYVDSTIEDISQKIENTFSGIAINLQGIEYTPIAHLQPGSFLVTVNPPSDGYPTAVFSISKGSEEMGGHVAVITAHGGRDTYERLELQWPSGGTLMIRKTGPGYNGEYIIDMTVKNLSGVPAPPVRPSDVATKGYVENLIREHLNVNFGGLEVFLEGSEWFPVYNLQPSSYYVTVSGFGLYGAPTATFAISKNIQNSDAHVITTTSIPGIITFETLELKWPRNDLMLIRKTGPGHNGKYIVDLGVKNFSSVPLPVAPSDAATIGFVREEIERVFQERWGGIQVNLNGIEYTDVAPMRPGSYLMTITSLVPEGPSAVFSISKNSAFGSPHMVVVSSNWGVDTKEMLELVWPPNSMVALRKTGVMYDGLYIIDMNMKNITPDSAVPVLPNETATKEYVDKMVKDVLQAQWGGISVELIDDEWVNVAAFKPGSYVITVNCVFDGGATASFNISKNSVSKDAHIIKLTSEPGLDTKETIELVWNSYEQLKIRKTGPFHDGVYMLDTNLRNFTTTMEPQIPSDVATMAYVDTKVETTFNQKFNGFEVYLKDTDFVDIAALSPGSYFIAVFGKFDGAATATFVICKSSQYSEGTVTCISPCPAAESGETLEMCWPSNKKIRLRKTGVHNDGLYVIDLNLKNISATPYGEISLPTDAPSRAEMSRAIDERMKVDFGGVEVFLQDSELSDVCVLNKGSYFIAVINTISGAPTGTWSVSKSSLDEEAHIVRLTHTIGKKGNTHVELVWNADRKLQIRKNSPYYDGKYVVDFNLKNFSTAPLPAFPSDGATREYVEEYVKETMDVQFSGILVNLVGRENSVVTDMIPGTYFVTVSPVKEGGPTSAFIIAKSSTNMEGHVIKLAPCPGADTGEMLEMTWPSNQKVFLSKNGNFHDGDFLVDFNLKRFTLTPPPQIESDIATVGFVERTIKEALDVKFGGITVRLNKRDKSVVMPLVEGSYIVAIRSLVLNGPTASFSISKANASMDAHVVKVGNSSVNNSECALELSWPADESLLLRKTSDDFDGNYVVDMVLKNFSNLPPAELPEDGVTLSQMHVAIEEKMQSVYGGLSVHLYSDEYSEILSRKTGAFTVAVSSKVVNGPVATFQVSKNDTSGDAHIVRITSLGGVGTNEVLELIWKGDEPMKLRKNGNSFDGEYLVDMNLRNSLPAMSDVSFDNLVTPEYVTDEIKKYMRTVSRDDLDISVVLSRNEWENLVDVLPGSYVLSISPDGFPGPTGTYSISKNSVDAEGMVVRISSHPGENLNEQLELRWSPRKSIQIRKSGLNYDGVYRVDLNLRNNSLMFPESSTLPLQTQTQIENQPVPLKTSTIMEYEFFLEGTEEIKVAYLIPGSYMAFLTCNDEDAYSGQFGLMKKKESNARGKTVPMNISHSIPPEVGEEITENDAFEIVLRWDVDDFLFVRKTLETNNGTYCLKIF